MARRGDGSPRPRIPKGAVSRTEPADETLRAAAEDVSGSEPCQHARKSAPAWWGRPLPEGGIRPSGGNRGCLERILGSRRGSNPARTIHEQA